MAKNITPRNQNFPQWYQDAIAAGELADNAPTRGCMIIRPTAFSLWESMQSIMDRMFKETGHQNAYFPLLIPESFIKKEAKHIEGFSPELAVVNYAGGKELEEPLIIRPTSETIIGHMYSKWLNSYRDLPILINQWCNVMRWEMRPRMFLRTSEFLWQEGHTAHETAEEAREETLKMLEVYRIFLEDYCAIPVITGEKPEHEKFPGAIKTYTLEAMMQDKKALQSGTSHDLGQNFAKAFDIKFLGRDNKYLFAHTTSWGTSTRMIGGIIMVHGDDDGIIIPPKIAPIKCVIIPMFKTEQERANCLEGAHIIKQQVSKPIDALSVKIDDRDDIRPSDKYFHWIQRGVPLRIEYGPKDHAAGTAMAVRRDTGEKIRIPLDKIETKIQELLEDIQRNLYARALSYRQENTYRVQTYAEMEKIFNGTGGFVDTLWDGEHDTAMKVKEAFKATIRVILEPNTTSQCAVSGNPSKFRVIYATAY